MLAGRTQNLLTSNLAAPNPMFVRGSGVHLELDDGSVVLDAIAGVGVTCLGYGNPVVAAAMARQAHELQFAHALRFDTAPLRELATEVAELLTPSLNHAYFVSGGSEAVESALKFARQYWLEVGKPAKWKPIGRWPSFHGNTLFAQSVGWHQTRRIRHEPMLTALPHIEAPNPYRGCGHCRGRGECTLACAHELDLAIRREGPDNVSCFIAEPIGAAATGAALPPRDDYFAEIRAICDHHDVLLIADEVFTGFGRTGTWFAIDEWSVEPDIVTFGKGIGGGFAPLAGIAVSDRLIDAFREGSGRFEHNFTYAGHAVACAAGLAVISELRSRRLVERVRMLESRFFDALGLLRTLGIVGDVRGKGLLAGVELVADQSTKAPFSPGQQVAHKVAEAAFRRGLLVYPCAACCDGVGDHLLLCPAFTTPEETFSEIAERLCEAVAEVARSLSRTPS